MIYFDNAATTWPKPVEVKNAVADAWGHYGANPGRGIYQMALKTARLVFEARATIADFFHAGKPERIVFTANTTEAINLVLKGYLKTGDHVLYSSMEHNAVYRPLKVLEKRPSKKLHKELEN